MNRINQTKIAPVIMIGVGMCMMLAFVYSYDRYQTITTKLEKLLRDQEQSEEHLSITARIEYDGETEQHKFVEELPPKDELDRIWDYVYKMDYNCSDTVYLGGRRVGLGLLDGAYNLCKDERVWPASSSNSDYKCLVYSFGVMADVSFDTEMDKLGCEVHSFDPAVTEEEAAKLTEGTGINFHKIAIAEKDEDVGFNGWKMRTLKTLIKELGHTGRYLDYLKVDTDKKEEGMTSGFEDVAMQHLLDTGLYKCVRQYSMEIHLPGPISKPKWLNRCRNLYRQMVQLGEFGWQIYNTSDSRMRFAQRPDYDALMQKEKVKMVDGKGVMTWEPAFVNLKVEGPCPA